MSKHPINLLVRFLLELSAWAAVGLWGWQRGDGITRYIFTILMVLLFTILWGIFRVPNDPGRAPVPVPGLVRLMLEAAEFSFAVWALFNIGWSTLAWVLATVLIIHYVVSYDRIIWLVNKK